MSDYGISGAETHYFEFWRGSPPQVKSTRIDTFTWPGVDGTGRADIGLGGNTIEVDLVSWHESMENAVRAYFAMGGEIDEDSVKILWNNVDMFAEYSQLYTVEAVTLKACKKNVALIGPGFALAGGVELTTTWRITPM